MKTIHFLPEKKQEYQHRIELAPTQPWKAYDEKLKTYPEGESPGKHTETMYKGLQGQTYVPGTDEETHGQNLDGKLQNHPKTDEMTE